MTVRNDKILQRSTGASQVVWFLTYHLHGFIVEKSSAGAGGLEPVLSSEENGYRQASLKSLPLYNSLIILVRIEMHSFKNNRQMTC
jgi:hypothetical protein